MTCVLVFVAYLDSHEPPSWTLTDTYLGGRIQDLAHELQCPKPGTEAATLRAKLGPYWDNLSPAIARIRTDIEALRWPDARACAVVHDAFASVDESDVARGASRRIWQSLADGGAPSLFWTYMFAATRRACERAVPSSQGLPGAMACIADDIAVPIARLWGSPLPVRTPGRDNRRPLCDARRTAIAGREWDEWARLDFPWDRRNREALAVLASRLSGSRSG